MNGLACPERDEVVCFGRLVDTALVASETNPGNKVSEILVKDPNEGETHNIQFVAGEGDDHNSLFMIDGNNLLAASRYNQFIGNKLSLRLSATDPTGAEFTKILKYVIMLYVISEEDHLHRAEVEVAGEVVLAVLVVLVESLLSYF